MGEVSGITIDIISSWNFWLVTILSSSISCVLFFMIRRYDFLFSDTIINDIMQNRFESNFWNKINKKKLEEIRKFQRSVSKFKRLYKMKNEEFENYADKRLKEKVEAFKNIKKSSQNNFITNKNKKRMRTKSVCNDNVTNDMKEKVFSKIIGENKKQSGKHTDNGLDSSLVDERTNNIKMFASTPSRFLKN